MIDSADRAPVAGPALDSCRILAAIHTFDDEPVIDEAIRLVDRQTLPVDSILIVDNASKDGIEEHRFERPVELIRHPCNTGTSGSVATALDHAKRHGFDWLWVLDADSKPHDDALEELLVAESQLGPDERRNVGALTSSHRLLPSREELRARLLTDGGPRNAPIDTTRSYYPCDAAIWSGMLIRVSAASSIEPP